MMLSIASGRVMDPTQMYQDKLSLLNARRKSRVKTQCNMMPSPQQMDLLEPTPCSSMPIVTNAERSIDNAIATRGASPTRKHVPSDALAVVHGVPAHTRAHDDPSRAHERSRGHHGSPRARAHVRPAKNSPTHAWARRRASNIALARALPMDDEEQTIAFEPLDDGVRFDAGPIALPDLTAFFADPLPSGTGCDIPTGTGALSTHEDEPMNELDPRLVDAIDAGSSEVGRQSPQVAYFLRNSRAPSTRRLYRWAWSRVLRSCAAMDRCAMPMSEATAALAIIDGVNDGLTIGSLRIVASVISVAHALAKQPDPTETEAFRSVLRGIGRVLTHQQDAKVALNADELLQIREACDVDPNHARGIRDWALVSFGFAGAFRRSEIVARNHADLEFVGDDLRVYLDRSKTDQFGRGAYQTIRPGANPKLCPIAALRAWIAIAPGPGPLFRPVSKHSNVLHRRLSVSAVSLIVKGFGVVLDLPDDRLGAHSLRAGMITALLQSGLGEIQTMEHSRHKSHDTLRRYFRPRTAPPNFTAMAGL